jgi:hypothetical protein
VRQFREQGACQRVDALTLLVREVIKIAATPFPLDRTNRFPGVAQVRDNRSGAALATITKEALNFARHEIGRHGHFAVSSRQRSLDDSTKIANVATHHVRVIAHGRVNNARHRHVNQPQRPSVEGNIGCVNEELWRLGGTDNEVSGREL